VVWEAFVEETKVVRVAVNWFMGEENLHLSTLRTR
jgi:hypothetical protein